MRVSFNDGKPKVTDGPFAEAKECVGGYWMIQVKSREEAIEWAKRAPMSDNEIIEVRQVQEMEDFSPEVRAAAAGFEDMSLDENQQRAWTRPTFRRTIDAVSELRSGRLNRRN